jgi:zinc transporter ZupT
MAAQWGWLISSLGVSVILSVMAWVNWYVYPICPFCAAGAHSDGKADAVGSHRHTVTLGWPLLAVGSIHSFLDGWAIGLPSNIFLALFVGCNCP